LRQGWGLLLEQGGDDPLEAVFATAPRDVIEAVTGYIEM
jgi:hypothetical protein